MLLRIVIGCALLVLVSSLQPEAFAAQRLEEVVRPQGLLLLGDFGQSVTLSYEYSGHTTNGGGGSSSATNHFKEKYSANMSAAVVDPHLLALNLTTDLFLDQSSTTATGSGSSDSKNLNFQYSLTGIAFDQDTYPVQMFSSREIVTVTTPYVPTYTLDTMRNGFKASYLNKILETKFAFERLTNTSNGLSNDYTSTTDNFRFLAKHDQSGVNLTELDLSVNSQTQNTVGTTSSSSRTITLGLNNTTYFNDRKNYSLTSGLNLQDAQTSGIPQTSIDWTENLAMTPGRALKLNLSNWYSHKRTESFLGENQSTSSNLVTASLIHNLFQSLETSVTGHHRQARSLTGTEAEYGGTATLTYRKKLMADSNLLTLLSGERLITDRNDSATLISTYDRSFSNVVQGQTISLTESGRALNSVVAVRGHNPDVTYVAGRDYTVNLTLGTIEILNGGTIPDNSTIYVSYIVEANARIIYATDTFSASSSLSLLNNRYRAMVSAMSTGQKLLSGSASASVPLNNTRTYTVLLEANYTLNNFAAEYSDVTSTSAKYYYVEGRWRFTKTYDESNFNLTARDRYTRYEALETRPGYLQNTADIGASYGRTLFSRLQWNLGLNYVTTLSDSVRRDTAYVRTTLQGRINKLHYSFVGQSALRMGPSQSSRDDYVRLEITRYF